MRRTSTWMCLALALALVSGACSEPDTTPASVTKQADLASAPVAGSANTISVLVATAGGKPLGGVPVAFAVTAGGGAVAPAEATTNESGVATATFTVDQTVGANSATATVTGVQPVTFSATSIAGPAASLSIPAKVTLLSVGASASIAAVAKDAYGNTATLPAISYVSRSTAAATVSATGGVTGVSAGQAMIVATSSAGSDSTLALVGAANGPLLLTDLSAFALGAGTDQVINVIMDMRPSSEKLGSTVVKLEWDPTVLTYQSHAAATGGPTATVNATTSGSGALALTVADAAGYSGQVPLVKLVFKAGSAGKTGPLKLSTTEVTAAGSFTSLTTKTVAASMPIVIR